MSTLATAITIRFTIEEVAAISAEAERCQRSLGWVVRQAVNKAYLAGSTTQERPAAAE